MLRGRPGLQSLPQLGCARGIRPAEAMGLLCAHQGRGQRSLAMHASRVNRVSCGRLDAMVRGWNGGYEVQL